MDPQVLEDVRIGRPWNAIKGGKGIPIGSPGHVLGKAGWLASVEVGRRFEDQLEKNASRLAENTVH